MKKIFTMAILFCLSVMCAMAQFRAEVGYSFDETTMDDVSYATDGFSVGAYYAFDGVMVDHLIVESGLSFSSRKGEDFNYALLEDMSFKKCDVSIPLNVGYEFGSNRFCSVRPYGGCHFTYNLKNEGDVNGTKIDYLDEDVVNTDVNKMLFGLHIGVLVKFKKHISLGYNTNMNVTELYNDAMYDCYTHNLSIGYSF